MHITIKNGDLSIDIITLLDHLDDQAKIRMIDTLSCEEAIIKHVTDQILKGWTEEGSHGHEDLVAKADPCHQLEIARREIAKRANEVARAEIVKLEHVLAKREEDLTRMLQDDNRPAYRAGQISEISEETAF